MILRRAIGFVGGMAALATAAAILLVALAFGLYGLLLPQIGPVWAAAAVALTAALVMAVAAIIMLTSVRRPTGKTAAAPADLASRLMELARAQPLVAMGALVAGGIIIARNPKIAAAVFGIFMSGRKSGK